MALRLKRSQEEQGMELFNVINILTRVAVYNDTTIVAHIRFEFLRFNLPDSY